MEHKITEQCKGCSNIMKGDSDKQECDYCSIWLYPEAKWKLGPCPHATHIDRGRKVVQEKVRVGQQKQRKKTKK